jgi:hypothetical protein
MIVGRAIEKIGPNWGYDHDAAAARTLMRWHTIMARLGQGAAV